MPATGDPVQAMLLILSCVCWRVWLQHTSLLEAGAVLNGMWYSDMFSKDKHSDMWHNEV